ncbi:MAG: nucleotide exchange factor GrpE [Chitinispirillia bacterium]|jgi:molecular chaperone GrpE
MCNNLDTEQGDLNVSNNISVSQNVSWKSRVMEKVGEWLDTDPEIEKEYSRDIDVEADMPDLYSFYAELCALRSDFKKGTRKSQDSLMLFSDVLEELKTSLEDYKNRINFLERTNSTAAKETLIKPIINIFIRFQRIIDNLNAPVQSPFFAFSNPYKKKLEKSIEGFSLVFTHLKKLLDNEGVIKTECLGHKFDPLTMVAVATEDVNDDLQPDMVVEEISPGFKFQDKVILLAKVKVATEKDR